MSRVKMAVQKLFATFGLRICRLESYEALLEQSRFANLAAIDLALLQATATSDVHKYFEAMQHSRSQLRQDLFALTVSGFKHGGYFVEFGATNGISLSNTHLLETKFSWTGILAEPAKHWYSKLVDSRNAHIEIDCVWDVTGDHIQFMEPDERELSTAIEFARYDSHASSRAKVAKQYGVRTISLMDLLARYDAPPTIDYLSIDTEGSEFRILSAFDFDAYRFGVITVEHNFTENRQRIRRLLESKGYRQVFETVSGWDDWYVYDVQ